MSSSILTGGQIPNIPSGLRGATIWVGPTTQVIKDGSLPRDAANNQILVRTGTVSATGLTYAFETDKQGNLDYSKVVGIRRADGTWQSTPYGDSIGTNQSFSNSLSRNGLTSGNLNHAAKQGISNGLRSAGVDPNTVDTNTFLGVQNQRFAGSLPDFRPPGAPALPGQTGGEADVAGTLNAVRTTITQLEQTALSITGIAASTRSGILGLKYPEEWPDGMDYIEFASKTYGIKKFDTEKLTTGPRTKSNTEESVILPLQSSISDANTVGWNEETLNPAQLIGANLAISGVGNGAAGFIGTLEEVVGKLTSAGNRGAVEKAIIAYFAEQAIGTQILSKVSGAVFNPNTELLFQGPQLRSFNFNFKLTPRTDSESKIVRQIIGFFKRNMAPQTEQSGLYLKAPKIFSITYSYNGQKSHPGIGLIKDCALQACNVEYTPDGSYMTFEDGSMVSYNLSLQFMELEPIYSIDYDDKNAKEHLIGY